MRAGPEDVLTMFRVGQSDKALLRCDFLLTGLQRVSGCGFETFLTRRLNFVRRYLFGIGLVVLRSRLASFSSMTTRGVFEKMPKYSRAA